MPKAPENTYWRGKTLWGRLIVASQQFRWSLRTGDAEIAKRRVEQKKAELKAAAHFGEQRRTYESAFALWSEHIVTQVGPRTAHRYATSLRQLEPFLRHLHIDEIARDTVSEIVRARRAAGVATGTIRNDLTALSSVLSFAEDEEWREGNPALDRLRRLRDRREPMFLPDPADVAKVIAKAPGNLKHPIRVAWLTGCRQEELVTAEHRRIDHTRRQLTVIGKRRKLRTIQLSDAAYRALCAVPPSPSKYLFWHSHGQPYANVAGQFRTLTNRMTQTDVTFRRFRFHDLRHLYAVQTLKAGGNIYLLSRHLGHTSVKTTEIYLSHLTPEEAHRAMYAHEQDANDDPPAVTSLVSS